MEGRRPTSGRTASSGSRLVGGAAVFFAAPVATRNGSVVHEYRQESDLLYLTGFDEPESVLVVVPGEAEHHVVMFVRPRDRRARGLGR